MRIGELFHACAPDIGSDGLDGSARLKARRGSMDKLAATTRKRIGPWMAASFRSETEQVEVVVGLDPSPRLLAVARRRAAEARIRAEFIQGSATAIPIADSTIDTIVMTWSLCSIPDPSLALREMRRVLRVDGSLLFIEHGLCPEADVARWQHRLTPIWRHVSGGCHLDRRMDNLIRSAGFELTARNEYAEGPRIFTYIYEGRARLVA